ncbi:MAG TPA: hypothetical protein VF520_13430 [Thermoleophilaceae bacterium]|jgi:hypothetical protein
MTTVPAAYPFIDVRVDTSALQPIATRAPGVVAVVGRTPDGPAGGDTPPNTPTVVGSADEAVQRFAQETGGKPAHTPLSRSLAVALLQDPRPERIYGVRVHGDDWDAALSSLEAADDVTFVANAPDEGTAGLEVLKDHVEQMSAQGQKRLGVAMISPSLPKSTTYVADALASVESLRSDSSRMIVIAARGANGDAATAAMAAMAAYPPEASVVLKRVRGIRMPQPDQYGPGEITALSEAGVIPIIDPALIVGEGLHMADGRCFTTDASLLFVDTVRTLDDIDFRLKAGLMGSVGDARITSEGLLAVRERADSILAPLKRRAMIADYSISIPVLDALQVPESSRSPAAATLIQTARGSRAVDLVVSVTYGPAVHHLRVTLAPKF